MGFIIEFHIVYLIKQKTNIKQEYYKTQQSETVFFGRNIRPDFP